MKDIMIDIETLGTRGDAMIIQIGACYFNRETGEVGKTYLANIDSSEHADKFSVDYSTVKWWFEQSPEARASVMSNPVPLDMELTRLKDFLEAVPDAAIWCHATFDMPIVLHAFQALGVKFPVHYRKMRDIRTLMDLSQHYSKKEREGTHHNALDDCKFQVAYCVEAMQKLNGQS